MKDIRLWIHLNAINAEDLGFNWMYIDISRLTNVFQNSHAPAPFRLREFIHVGGSCGYPGGCNNVSPEMPEIENLEVTGLPLHVPLLLWREQPTSVKSKPDAIFTISVENG